MHTLLIRIFVSFWLIIGITIGVAAVAGYYYAERLRDELENFEFDDTLLEASAALSSGGRERLRSWLRQVPESRNVTLYIVGPDGRDILDAIGVDRRSFGDDARTNQRRPDLVGPASAADQPLGCLPEAGPPRLELPQASGVDALRFPDIEWYLAHRGDTMTTTLRSYVEDRWVEGQGTLRFNRGKAVAVELTGRDVTRTRAAEDMGRKLSSQLEALVAGSFVSSGKSEFISTHLSAGAEPRKQSARR